MLSTKTAYLIRFAAEKARISGAGGYVEYGRVNGELQL
jgi:hypothetical protein